LPPGDHPATLDEIRRRFGFTPRRRWLVKGLRAAAQAFWAAGVEKIFIGGSFCTEKPDPGDIDGYWVEPDPEVYQRIDPYWIDFELVFVPHLRKWKWKMWRTEASSSSSTLRCRPAWGWTSHSIFGVAAMAGPEE
jgi:hypothetical protein